MHFALNIIQIIVSILLIVVILLQQKGAGLDAALGGANTEFTATRRGVEHSLHTITITLAVIFIVLALLQIVL